MLLIPNLDDDDRDGIADAVNEVADGDADLADMLVLPDHDKIATVTIDGPGRDHFRALRGGVATLRGGVGRLTPGPRYGPITR